RNAHAHNVITLPSHTNILTGLYPFQHGVRENSGFVLDAKHATIATMLHESGYATAAFIGAFPLDRRFGLARGFDLYDDNYGKGEASIDFVVQERRAAAVLDAATRWWRANEGKKRFAWIHLYDPHAPYAPPEPFASQYRDNEYLGEVAYVDSELQSQLPGTSLLQHAASSDSYFESLSASLNRGWAPLTGIIHRDLKYIDLPIAELYDLPRDPREVKNLRDDRRRDVDEARRLLAPMIVSPSPRTVDADTVAKLRSLGYVSGNASAKKVYTAADDPKNLVALDAKIHQSIDAFERHQLDRALQLA